VGCCRRRPEQGHDQPQRQADPLLDLVGFLGGRDPQVADQDVVLGVELVLLDLVFELRGQLAAPDDQPIMPSM